MACAVCSQAFHSQRRPTCASCARALLYEPRLQQASVLLNRNNFQAEAILRPGNDGVLAALPQNADWDAIASGIRKEAVSRLRNEFLFANERISELQMRVQQLRGAVLNLRDQVNLKSEMVRQRKTHLSQRSEELSLRSHAADTLASNVRKSKSKLQRVHDRLADAKASLCCTAAQLAGLKQETDRRSPTGRILLGKLPVPDLRQLAIKTQDLKIEEQQEHLINAGIDNVCRLVALWTHYLVIGTPAQMIMPRNDFPHPSIFPEKYSYKHKDQPQAEGTGSPTASRLVQLGGYRPRPLHLDLPLSRLAKEELKAFGLYVEGITLLAWNVAWLCKSQGITAINTFDDVCDIGRNLWLFYKAAEARATDALDRKNNKIGSSAFGVMSHGTVLNALAGHKGASLMQSGRLLQPHRLMDKLRSFLLTELTGLEWDVLSEHDYEDDREDELPVLVGGKRRHNPSMSIMSVGGDDNVKQEKGWTKIRGRPSEDHA